MWNRHVSLINFIRCKCLRNHIFVFDNFLAVEENFSYSSDYPAMLDVLKLEVFSIQLTKPIQKYFLNSYSFHVSIYGREDISV